MSSAAVPLHQIDSDISAAYLALRVARSARDRSPTAENERLVAGAERSLDRLLDERFAAQN